MNENYLLGTTSIGWTVLPNLIVEEMITTGYVLSKGLDSVPFITTALDVDPFITKVLDYIFFVTKF